MTGELSARQWQALQELVADGTLSAGQAAAVRARMESADRPAAARSWLIETAGYLGGALCFAGGALLVGLSWEDLSRPGRVLVLGAVTVLLILAAVVIAGGPAAARAMASGPGTVRRRVVSVLLAVAVGTAALTAGVTVDDYETMVGAVTGLALAALAYALLPNLPVLLAAAVLSVIIGTSAGEYQIADTPLRMGLTLTVIGICWAVLGLAGRLAHATAALVVGAAIGLLGAQVPLSDSQTAEWAYLLTLLVAIGCLAAYTVRRSVLLLALGVVGVTLVVSEAVADWSDGAAGGAAAVLAAGVVLLLGSTVAFRLHRRRH